jgi:hypothetical protein
LFRPRQRNLKGTLAMSMREFMITKQIEWETTEGEKREVKELSKGDLTEIAMGCIWRKNQL